jgi:hypothetical protein
MQTSDDAIAELDRIWNERPSTAHHTALMKWLREIALVAGRLAADDEPFSAEQVRAGNYELTCAFAYLTDADKRDRRGREARALLLEHLEKFCDGIGYDLVKRAPPK